jgi:hypothetical protein
MLYHALDESPGNRYQRCNTVLVLNVRLCPYLLAVCTAPLIGTGTNARTS